MKSIGAPQFGAVTGKTMDGHLVRSATTWLISVASRLRCQGLFVIQQNRKPKCVNRSTRILAT